MEGNIMHGEGGNCPMVQGNISAATGANVNLGPQLYITVAGQVVKDTAIEYIVQGALEATKSCLQIGDDLFPGAKILLVEIEDSLVDINDFIVIVEQSPKMDRKLMKLLKKLKDAAYDAQDLLEEYEITDRRRSEEAANSMPVRDTMTNKVRKVVTSVLVSPIIMRQKLKDLSERLEAIKAEYHTFQLEKKVTDLEIECKEQRETCSVVNKSQVIGRDEEEKKIVTLLLSTVLDDGSVIAIVGIRGLGKTTLAQSVFNHDEVQKHFQPKMWICVSDNLEPDNFDSMRLGNKILECATDAPHNLSDLGALQRRLKKELGGKRFLLVLDDVWNENSDKWHGKNGLRDLLLCGGKGSRIVVTTRSGRVASIMSKIQPHILKPLSEDVCWSLFCQIAFGNPTEEAAHPNLAPIGRKIVEKCKGNPLAVTIVGGLLRSESNQDKWENVSSESSQDKWENVRKSVIWNLDDENENGILPALRLSYIHLKPHLKQCFAFCAIFPQDYEIQKELLIKLWMAQGFIPTDQEGLMELEDIGNEIFDELVVRSFFQDVKGNVEIYKRAGPYSGVYIPDQTTFRMHDVMHDLAHSVMEKEYCVVLNGKVLSGKSEDISPRIRHVSSNGLGILAASLPTAQKLRTYVMLRNADFQFPCEVGPFKCLRALDFVGQRDKWEVKNSQLLTSLGNLQHLRYLNLSFTSIEMLPESLTTLCYLQTLILIGCGILCELPKEMSRLTNLRCLDITDCGKLTHMPPKMGQLSCLQELSDFIVGRTNEIACSGIRELQGLNLRGSLKIQLLKNITDAIDVPQTTLINIPNLTSLDLLWESSEIVGVDLDKDRDKKALEKRVLKRLQPHRSLKKLKIFHYGGLNFPSWMMHTTLTELVEITLLECWRCNHLPPLGGLPILKVLRIFGLKNVECIGNEFYGNEVSGGFPSLEELHIHNMQKLKTWSGLEWKGKRVFPSLVKLEISVCPMLTTMEVFPEDQIRSQSSLQHLQIENCDKLIFSGLGLRYLSSLEYLQIWYFNEFARVAHELSFLTSLQYLKLDWCHDLKSLPEGIGNLTSLRYLYMHNCPKMASLPRALQHLSALKRLYIYGCHLSLKIRYTKDTGEDWDKIQHIPYIRILGGLMEEGEDLLEPEGDEDCELVP